MKITPELLNAYNNTLANAAKQGKSHFLCLSLSCSECPFEDSDCCNIGVKNGGGELRTVPEWKKWFEELTQENRSSEDTAEDTAEESEPVKRNSFDIPTPFYVVSRTTLHVEAPVVRKVFHFEQLLTELDEFKKDLTAWVQVMRRNASEISVVITDYVEFHATDAEDTSIIDWAMSAEDFGKKKVWIDA